MSLLFNTGLPKVIKKYLFLKGIKVPEKTFIQILEEHSEYPSLLSLSDTLGRFNIIGKAFEVDSFSQIEFDLPCIAYIAIKGNGNDFVLVNKVHNNYVEFYYKNKSIIKLDRSEFEGRFKNYVFIIEKSNNNNKTFIELINSENSLKYKKILSFSIIVILIFCSIIYYFPNLIGIDFVSFLVLLVLNFTGVFTAFLLVSNDLNTAGSKVNSLCSSTKVSNCNVVLNSNQSVVLGYKLSEIALIFYLSSLIYLAYLPINPFLKFTTLAFIGIISITFIPYSLYIQKFVLKAWCPICLFILTLILINFSFTIKYISLFQFNKFQLIGFLTFVILFFILFLIWTLLKSVILKSIKFKLYYISYKRLQTNSFVFDALLNDSKPILEGWENIGIDIGNLKSKNTLIKICNPFCRPCSDMHVHLDELAKNYDVKVKIIFISKNSIRDIGSKVVKHLLYLYHFEPLLFSKALSEWYFMKTKDYNYFLSRYPLHDLSLLENFNHSLDQMSIWCEKINISYTPTLYFNGFEIPEIYSLEDFKIIFIKNHQEMNFI